MSSSAFLARFGGGSEDPELQAESDALAQNLTEQGGAAAFINKFAGVSESYYFYKDTIEIRFDKVEHKYFRVGELGELTLLLNVSTVSKIVDRSAALIPWAAKVTVEKMLRTIPTISQDGAGLIVPPMPFEKFSELAMAAKTAHKDKLEDAGDVGKMAHDWIEQYIKSVMGNDHASIQGMMSRMCADERATNCVIAALDWMKAHNVRWISTERKVYSKKHDCCGTLDGLCITDSCTDPACCPVPFKDRRTLLDWKTSNFLYTEFIYQASAYKAFYLEEFPDEVIEDIWILRLGKEDGEFQPWHLYSDTFETDFAGFVACLNLKRKAAELEERMKEEKAKIRVIKKKVRDEARAQAKEDEKAKKRAEREQLKAERAAEKERLKLEARAEREKLKAEKKKLKGENNGIPSTESAEADPDHKEVQDQGPVQQGPQQSDQDCTGELECTSTLKPNINSGLLDTTTQIQESSSLSPTTEHKIMPQSESTGLTVDNLNVSAKLERAGVLAIEETKPVFTSGIVVEEVAPSRPVFNIPTEG